MIRPRVDLFLPRAGSLGIDCHLLIEDTPLQRSAGARTTLLARPLGPLSRKPKPRSPSLLPQLMVEMETLMVPRNEQQGAVLPRRQLPFGEAPSF